MNLLFVSIGGLTDLAENAVYPDLLRCFRDQGHSVYIVCQREKRTGLSTQCLNEYGMQVLRVQTGNITKVGMLEKGISTITIGVIFKNAIKKYFSNIKFDLVLYSTPPITVISTVKYVKKRDNSFNYLMLKDIFPQNALDINILKKTGLSGVIYYYFRHREKQLYKNADYIGCMSTANEIYLQQHNSYLKRSDIGFCPNTINVLCEYECDKNKLRQKFQLPLDKTIFIYGGNFGKPQDVDYIIKILKSNEDRNDCHFIMCGSGTDFYKIKNYADGKLNHNLTVINNLDKTEYSLLLDACDVGLIFLDHRFTIPNFPSRLLDYMNHCLPVLSATDENTDVGNVILKGGFGWWCKSDSLEKFNDLLDEIIAKKANLNYMGMLGKKYLENHYNTNIAYTQIVNAYEVFRGK